ncbi:Transcriptional regulatory protein algP [Minicystis rosea]|nr:Transcriptional regulatory protein algP [Minicystis rosea]
MSMRGAEGNDAKDRRAGGGQRVHFEALVAVGENTGGGFEAESVDVSPDGMRLRTAYLPDIGDKLVCRFDGMGHEVVVEGEVIWRNEEAKGGEFGLRFTGLDAASEDAVRAMCASIAGPPAETSTTTSSSDEPVVPRGSRVRLHIEGLGSPMKARVRESAAREVEVGSNLEFLKVGRSLSLEDVEAGAKREALIDGVKVDVDPATNVPQLVVTLRYDRPGDKAAAAATVPAKKPEKTRVSETAPATRRAAKSVPPLAGAAKDDGEPAPKTARRSQPPPADEAEAHAADAEHDGDHDGDDKADGPSFGARAANAGRAVAGKLGPAITGMSVRAKGAMNGMLALIERRRSARTEAKKATAPRRTTAPPPGGALTSDGRRLVRDEAMSEDDEAPRPPTNRRAAALGGGLGLLAVLAIFAVTRLIAGRGHATNEGTQAAAALPSSTAEAPVAAAGTGTPVANVPLFGTTPLSTTEPLAPAPVPSAQASSAPGTGAALPGPDAPGANDDDDGPSTGAAAANGPILKEWGQGSVGKHPVVIKLKMDGAVERISGAAGAQGFTISIPGRRSVSSASDLSRKDKRLASVNVVNTSHGAEVSVQFKDDVPSYQARVKGDKLEIAIAKTEHGKVAKKKKEGGKKKKRHD